MAGVANNNNPFQIQTRISPAYIQLVPGPPGIPGPTGGVVTTTANFTQPAVGSNVTVSLSTVAGIVVGMNLFVAGGGFYSVTSVGSSSAVLTNLGTPGINLAPTFTVVNGATVVGSGPASIGVGTLNTVLLGQGSSAPAFSPWTQAAPGASGNVLTSDGTNWTSQAISILIPSPPALITGSFTPSASQTYLLAAGGASINLQNIVAGVENTIATRGVNGSATDPAITPVTLTHGSASFLFEGSLIPGPAASLDDRSRGTSAATGSCNTNGVDYRIVFDATANLIRCRGVS